MNSFRKKTLNDSDEDLLALYTQTNFSGYFGELYNRYIPLIYGLCLKYLQNPEKAGEATMELFKILLPEVSRHEIKDFKTWIYSVAKNHCLQIAGKEKQQILVDLDTSVRMESDNILYLLEGNGPKDEIVALNHYIQKLPIQQKISISLFFKEEMSYEDIAERTGYLLKTVKSHVEIAKKNLKICIEKHQNK